MAMTTTITERDKKLLLGLGIVLIALGFGVLLIKPVVTDLSDLRTTKIPAAQQEQSDNQMKINMIPSYEAAIENSREELDNADKEFFDMMGSQDIDNLLTSAVLSAGFAQADIKSLDITMPQTGIYADIAAYEDQTDNTASSSEMDETGYKGIYTAQAIMRISGTRDNLQNFLYSLQEQYPQILVTNVAWLDNKDSIVMTLTMDLYMSENKDLDAVWEKEESQPTPTPIPEADAEASEDELTENAL